MPAYFLDSSALVKFYVEESGTVWMRSLTDSIENLLYVVNLARVEVISGLTRRLNRGDITASEFDRSLEEAQGDFADQYRVVELTNALIDDAVTLAKNHGLRAYDAVQLATALEVRKALDQLDPVDFALVSADLELNAAAGLEGLQVEDPNDH